MILISFVSLNYFNENDDENENSLNYLFSFHAIFKTIGEKRPYRQVCLGVINKIEKVFLFIIIFGGGTNSDLLMKTNITKTTSDKFKLESDFPRF